MKEPKSILKKPPVLVAIVPELDGVAGMEVINEDHLTPPDTALDPLGSDLDDPSASTSTTPDSTLLPQTPFQKRPSLPRNLSTFQIPAHHPSSPSTPSPDDPSDLDVGFALPAPSPSAEHAIDGLGESIDTTKPRRSLLFDSMPPTIIPAYSRTKYNRKPEQDATYRRLTPELRNEIVEELNRFKRLEMEVHSESVGLTAFH
ncbi:hypothetical protein BC938DRAFT_472696 [Jimgerdemannia flammicorona]|uniref:Uncharacterized protein n=1 Tax=Jimgerdemannia flammicorona TaxID=994334 RepID=A0A433Q5K0_9FUNG|nr:hypothetical protein BC938DRAFT_472696 [Jimgerdemannia flammicorona]